MAWLPREVKGNEALEMLRMREEVILADPTPPMSAQEGKIVQLLRERGAMRPAAIGKELGIIRKGRNGNYVSRSLVRQRDRGLVRQPAPGLWEAVPLEELTLKETHRTKVEVGAETGTSYRTVQRRLGWLQEMYPMHHEWDKPIWRGRPQRLQLNSGHGKQRKKTLPVLKNMPKPEPVPVFEVSPAEVMDQEIVAQRYLSAILGGGVTDLPSPRFKAL